MNDLRESSRNKKRKRGTDGTGSLVLIDELLSIFSDYLKDLENLVRTKVVEIKVIVEVKEGELKILVITLRRDPLPANAEDLNAFSLT